MTTAERCLDTLRGRGETLATAESLTAGLLSATLADVAGASDVLRGGIAAYATDTKIMVLGVDPDIIDGHGVVSGACAEAMARQARGLFGADWGLSTTGVAGPDPQDGVPVGAAYVAVAGHHVVQVEPLSLDGSRNAIREQTVEAALALLLTAAGTV